MQLLQQSVYSYITTLIDLYQIQKAIKINSYLFLQEDSVREYLKILQQRDIQHKKEQFANKGRDTLFNSYTKDKFQSVYYKFQARGVALFIKYHFHMLINILSGHYMLICGSDRCFIKILDIFTFKFKGEGPIYYIPLIFTTRIGKQNQHSRFKIIGALRNRKPLIYIFSRLAFYLLYRQDFSIELFLDFNRYLVQYNIHLIKSNRDYKVTLLYNLQ